MHLIIAFTGAPAVPENLRVTDQHKEYISLAWDSPQSDGGAPITGFVIEKRDASRTLWTGAGRVGGSTLKAKIGKLFEGTEYMFRVAAENAIGQGEFIELKNSVTAKLPFGKCFGKLIMPETSVITYMQYIIYTVS